LFPNQFVNVRLLVKTLTDVTLVPEAAIQRNNDVAFVYVIQPDSSVKQQNIKIIATEGQVSAVTGVTPGQQVVTDGFDRLQNGSKITIRKPQPKGAPDKCRRATPAARSRRRNPRNEPVPTVHPAADCDLAADGGDSADRHHRLSPAADRGAARSGLSDHAGADLLSGRQPGCGGLGHDRAAGEAAGRGAGLNQMLSTSSFGASVITLQFNLSLDIDIAEQDVQEAINAAQNFLPAGFRCRRCTTRSIPADAPILTLAL
jgi:multidrug efflux system membrane fusion protein